MAKLIASGRFHTLLTLSHARLAISSASAKSACMSLVFIKPQLATAVDHPPPRAGWIHEVKHDGYRTILIIERRKTRAYTQNGFDWTDRYFGLTKAAAHLDCRSAIIDGEVIVQNEQGVSDFNALKSAIRWRPQSLILCAFDLLHLSIQQ